MSPLAQPPRRRSRPRSSIPAPPSEGEATLRLHLRAQLPRQLRPVEQHAFSAELGRAHRIDFAWPDRMLAVEVDGAVHRIRERFRSDLERHNLLQVLGWRVLRFSPADVRSGKAVDTIAAVLAADRDAALAAIQRKE